MARSTPAGRAAIALVRLSGPEAIAFTDRSFRGSRSLAGAPSQTLTRGCLLGSDGQPLDEVVVGVFRAPRSYTGEDVVEISCHGNPVIVEAVLDRMVALGARPAGPGELTRRAFLNGKLDLAAAEAVARLIEARSRAGARGALAELGGGLARRVNALRSRVVATLAALEADVDFPDDDLAPVDTVAMRATLDSLRQDASALLRAVRSSRRLGQVATVAIAGATNAGKSSLFNALVGRERAIVHQTPGTTRDVVDAEIAIGLATVRLIDTAGLGEPASAIEADAMRRSEEALRAADRVLLVLDRTRAALEERERELLAAGERERTLIVLSKRDLPQSLDLSELAHRDVIGVSAMTGEGVSDLERALERTVLGGDASRDASLEGEGDDIAGAAGGSERVQRALENAHGAATRAVDLLVEPQPALELVAEELRALAEALGLVTGERVGDDVLDVIFSRFCIGK